MSDDWHTTACILCSVNCGIEVRLDGRRIARVRGDKAHPASQGYTCEKALRLDHYQNGRHRLTTPLRRRADGTFERDRLGHRDRGDRRTAGARSATPTAARRSSTTAAAGRGTTSAAGTAARRAARSASSTRSNALAQEKTGEFWVDGQLFGRPRCHTTGDYEHAEVAVFVGKNPWQSHGFPRARSDPQARSPTIPSAR